MLKIIPVLFCIWIAGATADQATPPTAPVSSALSEIKALHEAESSARVEVLTWLGLAIAVIGLSGLALFKLVERKLLEVTRNQVLENEARSLIRLGVGDFENFEENKQYPDTARSSLVSAVTHTRQALVNASSIENGVAEVPKLFLVALASANLGYYYCEMMNNLPVKDRDHREKYRKLALESIRNASLPIAAARRRREESWWEMVESSVHVHYHCSKGDKTDAQWMPEKRFLQKEITSLIEDKEIPSEVRQRMINDWSELLAEQPAE